MSGGFKQDDEQDYDPFVQEHGSEDEQEFIAEDAHRLVEEAKKSRLQLCSCGKRGVRVCLPVKEKE